MSRAELIYPLKERIEKEILKLNEDIHNGEILIRYYKVRSSQLAIATVFNNLNRLRIMSQILQKKFADATKQDIENLVFEIDRMCKSPNTANKYKKILKKFYQWMRESEPEYPPEVKWIRMRKVPFVAVSENDLIPFEEALRITECASNLRDKALFQCKLDAGCRIGEILTPRIEEVKFNDGGAIVYSDGKTGYQPIILTWSAKILAQWLNIHPFRHDPTAPLWPLLDREKPLQLSYAAAYNSFKKCVKKSGCPKRVWPHLFKHISSSYDSEIGLSDSYRKFKHHWTPDSKMAKVYEHLSSSIIPKIQNQTLRLMGMSLSENQDHENEKKITLIRKCRRCDFENSRDSLYCNRCAFPLAEIGKVMEKRIKLEQMLHSLISDPQELENLRKYLTEKHHEKSTTQTP